MTENSTTSRQQLSPVKRAFLALQEMQARCEALEQARREPIAIVGLACRFPGADDSRAFWDLLAGGRDAVGEVPAGRWNREAYGHADAQSVEESCARLGGFLRGPIDQFDPHFFGIAPREARCLDPQQRLLLEVGWEALEHAGQIKDRLAPSRTGVFVGITSHDYSQLLYQAGAFDQLDNYFISGTSLNAAAGRLSYTMGFQGPCMAIDTACSSSLVAIHQACRSLLDGDCDRALAGGVNLILSPLATIALARGGVLATDGKCKAFDAAADGMVRGEGCAVIVLKRLTDALAEGDNVLAVIRGSAVNQDGASSGLTVPNGPAQEAVIRQALDAAGLAPDDIDYVEAHGTGTSLGDPIEAHALSNVFGRRDRPLVISSVKTNIGHLEAASGIAGVVKVVLALRHQEVPRHLHFRNPSPHIRWEHGSLLVPTRSQPWSGGERLRLAGVSSFGFSGTNAHLILGDPPPGPATSQGKSAQNGARHKSTTRDRPLHVLALSAKTNRALVELAGRYEEHLAGQTSDELPDICFTANVGRGHWQYRLALVGASPADFHRQLSQVAAGRADSDAGQLASQPDGVRSGSPRLAMLFTGRAADMDDLCRGAHELYETQPAFRETLEHCEELLQAELDRPLLAILFGPHTKLLDHREYAWPAIAAVQYALGRLWTSWGVRPSLIVGQGIGEYVGACLAGILDLGDALTLAAKSAAQPASLAAYAGQGTYRPPQIPFMGWGGTAGDAAVVTPRYWSQVRDPDAPGSGPDELQRRGCQLVLSLGAAATSNHVLAPDELPAPMNPRGEAKGSWQSMLESLTELYRRGMAIDWQGFDRDYHRRRVILPTYPFQREPYWHEARSGGDLPALAAAAPSHPLRGPRLNLAGSDETRFESRLSPDHPPFLRDHCVFGNVVFPVAALLEVAMAAGAERLGTSQLELRDIVIEQPMVLPESETLTLQTVLTPRYSERPDRELGTSPAADEFIFQIYSHPDRVEAASETWTRHAVGTIVRAVEEDPRRSGVDLDRVRNGPPTTTDRLYDQCSQRGIEFGESFRTLQGYWRDGQAAVGHVKLPDPLKADIDAYTFHPALLDGGLQILAAMGEESTDGADPHLPVAISRFRLFQRPGGEVWSHLRPQVLVADRSAATGPSRPASLTVDLEMVSAAGEPVAAIEGLQLKAASRDSMLRMSRAAIKNWLYRIEWRPSDLDRPLPETDAAVDATFHGQEWLVLSASARDGSLAAKLARNLESRGASCTRVSHGDQFQRVPDGSLILDPMCRDHFPRLLGEIASPSAAWRGVLLVGGSPADLSGDAPSRSMQESNLRDCASLLYLVQAIVAAGFSDPPKVWTIGRGAQAVLEGESLPGLTHSALWGLAKTIPLEHPELDCRYLDLDPDDGDVQFELVCAELAAAANEQHVAFRHARRHVARIVPYREPPATAAAEIRFQADASYLITGGLRGLGLEVAGWMARQGAGRLVLAGRTAPGDEARRRIEELQRAGTVVDFVATDVSDAAQVAGLMDGLADGPPLRGVVHCAMVLDDGIVMQQTAERFRAVLAPKVAGAWNLHELTGGAPLDFFLLFSSAASVLGSTAQSSYCAANAFLDSLAEHRRGLGLPGLSINWGPWSGAGIVARSGQDGDGRDLARDMRGRGIQLIAPRQGMQVMEQLLAHGPGQVAVLPGNWSTRAAGSPDEVPSLLRELVRADANASSDGAIAGRLQALHGASGEDRRATLVQVLRDDVAAVLRSRPDQIEVGQPLNMLGLDSLMAVELRIRVNAQFRIDVPMVKFMEGQSVVELAGEIDRRISTGAPKDDSTGRREPREPVQGPVHVNDMDSEEAQRLLARLDDLSDAEVEALLAGRPDKALAEGTDS